MSRSGKSVAVLDADRIGQGATHLTTAFITADIDTDNSDLIAMVGVERARHIWQSGEKAIDFIEQAVKKHGIDCEFKRIPLYIYANSNDELPDLKNEFEALKKMGVKALWRKNSLSGLNSPAVIEIPNQAKYHPLKFLRGLAKQIIQKKGFIFEKTEVLDFKRVGSRFRALTKYGTVTCDHLVIATHQPFKNPKEVFAKKGIYITYVMEAEAPKNKLKEGIYIDLQNPYHYFRVDPQEKYDDIIFGGEDHRKEIKMDSRKNFTSLQEHFERAYGGKYKIVKKWTGPIIESIDGLALIGEASKNLYVATAFSGNGMTYAPIAGAIIRDLILNKKNSWIQLYDPKRLPNVKQLIQKSKDYVGEIFGGAVKNALRKKTAD